MTARRALTQTTTNSVFVAWHILPASPSEGELQGEQNVSFLALALRENNVAFSR
jgi:hypothetical protein